MLAESELVAFVSTADPERSRPFYEDVLGLTLVADEQSALVFETPNATLRVAKTGSVTPSEGTVLGWEVSDVEAVVADLQDRGVDPRTYDGIPQDEDGIATFPDGTQVAWFDDPDGNTLSVTEPPGE
jgi:catechol 2,3-dioxygenase-like lactoylglutathione lyase family enzyme